MRTGDRIKKLRKSKNFTQLELANKLNITDKAVSKWESNLGEPSIDLLLELSKLFDVSIDYLLTGKAKETIRYMSFIERVAYEDDPDLLKTAQHHIYEDRDPNDKCIVDYIYQYEAIESFLYLAKGQFKDRLIRDFTGREYLSDLIKMSLITGYFDLLSPKVSRPLIPLYQISIVNDIKEANKKHIPAVENDIVDFILHSTKIDEKSWKYLLNTSGLYWNIGLSKILEEAVKEKHHKLNEIVDIIDETNKEINNLIKNSIEYTGRPTYELRNNIVYKNNIPVRMLTDVNKETVLAALANNDYELANRLNKMSNYKVSEYELKMDKVNKDKTMTKKEKLIESVLHNGIVHIDDLIALDNYELYLKGIKYPASELERLQMYVEQKEYKKLFQATIDLGLNHTKNVLIKDDLKSLDKSLISDFTQKPYKPNAKYLYSIQRNQPPLGKNGIYFSDILNHKDLRFFIHACKTDPSKKDWALEKLITDRTDAYELQKLLLDEGAKIHKRWQEDDGWGYMVDHDKIDDVATELLRNQLQILMKEGK
jgi:transcriptional regulator with XRE-family HTH domain